MVWSGLLGDAEAWVTHPHGVVRYDLSTGRELARFAVPGLLALQRVRRVS